MSYDVPESVLRAALEREEVLLNSETGQYHVLNDTGRRVLVQLQDGKTPEQAAKAIAAETNVASDTVRHDVDTFVAALVERGLLRHRP
jgi:hypothetical protein